MVKTNQIIQRELPDILSGMSIISKVSDMILVMILNGMSALFDIFFVALNLKEKSNDGTQTEQCYFVYLAKTSMLSKTPILTIDSIAFLLV